MVVWCKIICIFNAHWAECSGSLICGSSTLLSALLLLLLLWHMYSLRSVQQ